MIEKIKNETEGVVENWMDDILFYLTEYPEERDLWAAGLIASFTLMVLKLADELNERDAENVD